MSEVRLILERCAWRHWRLAWRQQVALMLILALGSGVYLAMRLANRAALSGFEQFTSNITQQADWTVTGTTGPMPETWLREMRDTLAERPVHLLPVVEETVSPYLEHSSGEIGSRALWRLVGTDFVSLLNLRGAPLGVEARSGPPEGVFVSAKRNLHAGDELRVVLHERVILLKVAGVIPVLPGVPAMPETLLLMDLPAAQALMQREGKVDRVEVLVPRGEAFPKLREETGERLRDAAKNRWLVSGAEDRRALAGTMTEAFRLNLTILSLLALFVGGYLMFQALDGVVIRRREEIGILKSLGVTDTAIQRAFLVEALLLGLLGGALGLGIGWLGAQGAVIGVSKTVNALYGATSAQSATLDIGEAALSLGIALVTSLLAAWWPAREAARTPPVHLLGRKNATFTGGAWWRMEWVGWALMALAVGLAQLAPVRLSGGTRLPLASYAAALSWLLGTGLAAGWLLPKLAHWNANSATRRVAWSHLRRPTVRHRFAVAALASAVAMTSGMAIMVSSFEATMRSWIERSMKADLYVSSAGAHGASSTHQISAETVQRLRMMPEVAEVAALRARRITLRDAPTTVLGVNAAFAQRHDLYAWVKAPLRAEWWRSEGGTPALVNESFAERFAVDVGETIDLPGGHRVVVSGIHADYGNESGSVTVTENVFLDWFHSDMAWRVAIMLQPGSDAALVAQSISQAFPGLSVFTNEHLRREALRIFRQTFSVTHALEVIGVIVSVAGLGLALASLLLERSADLATLRSLGMTGRQIAAASAWEGAGVALAGGIMGLFSGCWLGWLLIYRVNKQCFGWTLGLAFPSVPMVALLLAVVLAGALVSAIVGQWAGKLRWSEKE
ncbi:MAG: FtsX-like permease family protein [Roseimicrobium sp.]